MKMVLVGAARVKVENGKFIIPTRVIMIYIDYRPQRDIPGVPLVGIDSIVLLLNCIAGLCAWVSMQPMTLAVEDMRSGNTKRSIVIYVFSLKNTGLLNFLDMREYLVFCLDEKKL